MPRIFRAVILRFIFISIFLAGGWIAGASTAGPKPIPALSAEAAVLIEVKTGQVLVEKNPDRVLSPASLTKMMTEYLVLEAVQRGDLSWSTIVVVSPRVGQIGQFKGISNIGLKAGDQCTVEDLFAGMAVRSGNDSAAALAERIDGDEGRFVFRMNSRAIPLGLTNSRFVNSSGLPNGHLEGYWVAGSPTDENRMSAYDTAILALHLLRDFPEILRFSSMISCNLPFSAKTFVNANWMLPGHPNGEQLKLTYPGMDGLKTGYTDSAGYCLAATAERAGIRLLSVVMRAPSSEARYQDTRLLLDYGFGLLVQ